MLFIHESQDLYSAETQLVKALPRMAKAATNEDPLGSRTSPFWVHRLTIALAA